MAEGAGPALGLSIGSTNLAAVTADHAITRKPVLTLFRQRPPEVGVPSENPKLDEPGLVITDFVDRVGDPLAIEAADGSVHRSEALAADALRALAYAATGGRPLPRKCGDRPIPRTGRRKAVDELGSALSRVSEWSNRARPLTLIPDAAAALFAVRANPGVPARRNRRGVRFRRQRDQHHACRRRRRLSAAGPDRAPSRLLRRPARSGAVDGRDGQSAGHGFFRPFRHLGDRLAGPAPGRMPNRQGAALVEHRGHAARRSRTGRTATSGSPGPNSTTRSAIRLPTSWPFFDKDIGEQRNSRF